MYQTERENVYELVYYIRMGNTDAARMLVQRYDKEFRYMTKQKIQDSALVPYLNMYEDDIVLEAMLSLNRAVSSYREDGGSNMSTYIHMVAERRVRQVIRRMRAHSGRVHANAYSLDEAPYGSVDDMDTRTDLIPSQDVLAEPEFHYQYHQAKQRLNKVIASLNHKEKAICACWQEGLSYEDAGKQLNISAKAYDGRLRRLKRKLLIAMEMQAPYLRENDTIAR
ncbi:MAG: sigma-70 family RNA polymerase sigma factor [Bulleidia sp.]|nr:sigma-70 family RNA polymerase sigma factor [Bulleidia sp.]